MAPRKKNPLDDVAKTVGNWLGGAARAYADITDRSRDVQPGRAARVQAALDATRAIGKVADAATGGFGSAVVSDARRMAKTGSSTPSALYKTAAVNLAAGVGGAKAAQVAGRAVAATGIPARAVNKLTGQKVIVHASPQTGLRQIDPRLGSNQLPEQNVVFGFDPRKTGAQQQITRSVGKYVSKKSGQPAGSVYVAKFKKSDIVTPPKLISSGQVVSKSSAKVVQEIPVAGKTFAQVDAELQRQLRRAGAAAKPDVSRGAAVVSKTTTKIRQTFMTQAQKDAARRKRIR